jgi:hypothetical protein
MEENKIKTFIETHKTELGSFGTGFVLGALCVYTSIHRGIRKFCKGLNKFINE